MKSVNKTSPKIRRLNEEKEIVSLSSCRLKLLDKRLYINISILYGNLKDREVAHLVQHNSKANRAGNRVTAPRVLLLWPLHGVLWRNWSCATGVLFAGQLSASCSNGGRRWSRWMERREDNRAGIQTG